MASLLEKAQSLGIKPYGQMSKEEKVKYHQSIAKKFQAEAALAESEAGLTGLARKVVKATGLEKATDTLANSMASRQVSQEARQFVPQNTTGEKVGAALQIGSLLAPVGTAARAAGAVVGKTAGNIIAGAGTGYAMDVGANLAEGKTGKEAFTPGVGTAVGTVVPGSIAAAGAVSSLSKKAGTKLKSAITPIDKTTETVLDPTKSIPKEVKKTIPEETLKLLKSGKSEKLEYYLNKARRAVANPSLPTPLEFAGKKAEEVLSQINKKLSKQGQLKKSEVAKNTALVIENIEDVRKNMLLSVKEATGGQLRKGKFISAPGREVSVSDPADIKLLGDVNARLKKLGNAPSFRQVDDTVDYLQDLLYKKKSNLAVPVNSKVESILKRTIGELNGRLKSIGGETYRKSNQRYSAFIEVRDRLNKALGADASKGGSLMKRVFSPTDGGTKILFAKIRKITGIDLNEEAVLAKFAMESAGDARQASLLEQLEVIKSSLSPSGLVSNTVRKGVEKLQDPIGKARNIVGQSNVKFTPAKKNSFKSPGDFLFEKVNGNAGLSIKDVSKDATKQVQYYTKSGWKTMDEIAKAYMDRTVASKDEAIKWAREKVKGMQGRIKELAK